jgi:hypothetical protein
MPESLCLAAHHPDNTLHVLSDTWLLGMRRSSSISLETLRMPLAS